MLLGDFDGCNLRPSKVLLANPLAAATMLIASQWKLLEAPSMNEWLGKVRFLCLMGKRTAIGNYRVGQEGALQKYYTQWEPFWRLKYVGNLTWSMQEGILPII